MIRELRPKMVEFLFDRAVTGPAVAVGERGEVKMIPEKVARKLAAQSYGRLTSEVVTEEELEGKPDEPKALSDNIVARLESMGFVRNPESVKPVKEKNDGTGDKPDSRPDIQGGDGDKTSTVRNRKRRKGMGASAPGP